MLYQVLLGEEKGPRFGSFVALYGVPENARPDRKGDCGSARNGQTRMIYKIVPTSLWRAAEAIGTFVGAPVDLADGFIHFSAAGQVAETAARHFAGQSDLMLVAIDPATLGAALKWERSRGGALFPHLFAPLPVSDALWARPLPLGADGFHDFSGFDL